MSHYASTERERYLELLATDALGWISDEEQKELDRLFDKFADIEPESFQRIAAAVDLSYMEQDPAPLPAALQDRIAAEAESFLPVNDGVPPGVAERGLDRRTTASVVRERLAWICAAASLLVAIVLSSNRPKDVQPLQPKSSSARRADFLKEASDVITVVWSAGKTPFRNPVQGDVVWSDQRQEGYLRFRGMPVNDPTVEQYQLWIIDPSRDDEPVDGGVFDISVDGEVVIPINAKLHVESPRVFAITVEQPGGVVVSTQDRLPLLAQVN